MHISTPVTRRIWKTFRSNKTAFWSLPISIAYLIVAFIGPYIAPYPALKLDVGPTLAPPSFEHLMGTDDLGRDIFSNILYGTRYSLLIGILAPLLEIVIGVLAGSTSGFLGGHVDMVLMRIADMFLAVPRILIALIMVAIFGPSFWNVIWIVAILGWPRIARIIRGEYLSLRESDFALVARALGFTEIRIIFSEILPIAMIAVIPLAVMEVSSAILLESALSFLGFGDPNTPTWGYMIYTSMRSFFSGWWTCFFPGFVIALAAISFNLIGDGLSDALNPRALFRESA